MLSMRDHEHYSGCEGDPAYRVDTERVENLVLAPATTEAGDQKTELPRPGETFADFYLLSELGRGAFGRVFLARQRDLAGRLVALKVARELLDEKLTLAQLQHSNIVPIYSAHQVGRLQAVCMPFFGATTLADVLTDLRSCTGLPTTGRHFLSTLESRRQSSDATSHGSATYDASHPAAAAQALSTRVGQPNFDLLSQFSFSKAVLWMGARLADALAHAHERGVIHRDLKPANVLLADDGRPMILDFNLAVSGPGPNSGRGGTIPYMAPEQIAGAVGDPAARIDGRTDVYALGLLLYELLAGRPPFARHPGSLADIASAMLSDRRAGPADIVRFNPDVTPAVEAIVRKCLAFRPADRYPGASELRDDLERQLADQPLLHIAEPSLRERGQKWLRRHPRLSSAATIATVATALVLGVGWSGLKYREAARANAALAASRHAERELQTFLAETDYLRHDLVRAPEGESSDRPIAQARAALARYGIPDDQAWAESPLVAPLSDPDRAALASRLGELTFVVVEAELDHAANPNRTDGLAFAERLSVASRSLHDTPPRAWWAQRSRVLSAQGREAEAAEAAAQAEGKPAHTIEDRYLLAVHAYRGGRCRAALEILEPLAREAPDRFAVWHLLGVCQYRLNRDADAVASFNACASLSPKNARTYYNRGLAYFRQGLRNSAAADFDRAMQLGDSSPDTLFKRAQCCRHPAEAEAIIAPLVDRDDCRLRALLVRSELRRRQGKRADADADRKAALAIEPRTAADYNARGLARRKDEPAAALDDFVRAERLAPSFTSPLQNQADVLANSLNRPEDAVAALDRLLARSPDQPAALAGRAVMLARLGRVEEALRDAKTVLGRFDQPRLRYQVAGVYALTADRPGHLSEAIRLLTSAIRERASLAELLADDPELKPIHDRPEFRKLLGGTASLRGID